MSSAKSGFAVKVSTRCRDCHVPLQEAVIPKTQRTVLLNTSPETLYVVEEGVAIRAAWGYLPHAATCVKRLGAIPVAAPGDEVGDACGGDRNGG